jgi:hypothetical protein
MVVYDKERPKERDVFALCSPQLSNSCGGDENRPELRDAPSNEMSLTQPTLTFVRVFKKYLELY